MVFPVFILRRKSRISVSLSDEVIGEAEMRGLKRSNYYEDLIGKDLELEPEENVCMKS